MRRTLVWLRQLASQQLFKVSIFGDTRLVVVRLVALSINHIIHHADTIKYMIHGHLIAGQLIAWTHNRSDN